MTRLVTAIIIALTTMMMGVAYGQPPKRPLAPSTAKKAPNKPVKKPILRGSKEVAKKQNAEADKERLTRIKDEQQLKRFIESGILVPLPENVGVRVNPQLDARFRYCRPWTRKFLEDFGKAYALRFPGDRVQINSAVRPLDRQAALRGMNRNAAPIKGATASSHPTASTVDLAKSTSSAHNEWMRDYLRQKKTANQIVVAEEFMQPVFHVMVLQNYGVKKKAALPTKKAKTLPKKSSHR